MIALEIDSIIKTGLKSKPVIIQDVRQDSLHELTREHDLVIRGNDIRVPAGTVICLTGFGGYHGKSANHGHLTSDLHVCCKDGATRILPNGSAIHVIL